MFWRPICFRPSGAEDGSSPFENQSPKQEEDRVADYKVTVEEQPDGKWACFLHVPGEEPYNLGKTFKNEERAEAWLTVGEATTAIDMAVAKLTKK
jgi:hypothetical protein